MEWPKTTKWEDALASEEALRIFGQLRKKYCNNSGHDLDIVLNSLCFALVRMAKLTTRKEDAENFANLVKTVILNNLKEQEGKYD